MKVTVDTRHDSLEEALAAVQAAFGSTGNSPSAEHRRNRRGDTSGGNTRKARRTRSGGRAVAASGASSAPAKRSPRKVSAAAPTKSLDRNARRSTGSVTPAANVAPPGQADAIRAWAKTQGMEVKQAGRLPAVVIRAYQERPHRD